MSIGYTLLAAKSSGAIYHDLFDAVEKNSLTPEDQELLEEFEAGEFESDLKDERRTQLVKLAKETIRKDKRINIRISSRDLEALQRRALEEGLPYQSLVSSVLHKYVSGGLKDISTNKALQRTSHLMLASPGNPDTSYRSELF